MDRALLTEALECYYGGTCLPNHEAPPVSTSEQRMRTRLGLDVAQLFARSILAGQTFGKLESYENAYEEAAWEYVAELQFSSHITGSQSSIFIYLDTQLVDEMTSRLTPPAPPRRAAARSTRSASCRCAWIAWSPACRCRWRKRSPCAPATSCRCDCSSTAT